MADENTEVIELAPEVIAEAKELGWADQAAWKGKPEAWVNADVFLDKAAHILPILREQKKTLTNELGAVKQSQAQILAENRAMKASLAAIEETQHENLEEKHAQDVAQLEADIAAASEAGDHKLVAKLTMEAAKLAPPPEKKAPAAPTRTSPAQDPQYVAWVAANTDFATDPIKVAMGQVVATQMRAAGNTLPVGQFLDEVKKEVEKKLTAGAPRPNAGKGGGGNGGTGRTEERGGIKSYADLPAEAKAQCDKDAKRLVGPNKVHKTAESWQKSFVSQYFKDEE